MKIPRIIGKFTYLKKQILLDANNEDIQFNKNKENRTKRNRMKILASISGEDDTIKKRDKLKDISSL